MGLYVLLAIGALVLVGVVVMFNRIVAMRRLTDNAWSDVDVYLKRRAELVPNLVEAVKGAAAYERATLEQVTQARAQALSIHDPTPQKAQAESELRGGLARMVAVAESYPELRANQSFLRLQEDLSETERLIASARQYYNACVRDYNTMIESFPQNLIASAMNLKPRNFFEIEDLSERSTPGVRGL